LDRRFCRACQAPPHHSAKMLLAFECLDCCLRGNDTLQPGEPSAQPDSPAMGEAICFIRVNYRNILILSAGFSCKIALRWVSYNKRPGNILGKWKGVRVVFPSSPLPGGTGEGKGEYRRDTFVVPDRGPDK